MTTSNGNEFRQVVGGRNFMTPKLSGYFQSGDYQCEISRGSGIDGQTIYGVTVVNTDTMQHDHDLSKLCHSLYEAKAYIKKLA